MKHRFLNRWTIILFIAALLPRIFGLGQFLTSDENTNIYLAGSAVVQAFLQGDFRGTYWHFYPGVTMSWLDALGMAGQWFIARAMGATDLPLSAFVDSDIRSLLVATRLPYAILTALFIPVVYLLLRRWFELSAVSGQRSAVIAHWLSFTAALLIAFDPFFLAHSRVVHGDAPVAVFMVLSVLALFIYLGAGRQGDKGTRRQGDKPALPKVPNGETGRQGAAQNLTHHALRTTSRRSFLRDRGLLLFSAVMGSLAALTKAPGQFMAFFVVIAVVGDWLLICEKQGRLDWTLAKRRLLDVVIWGVVALAVFFLIWPSMWVDPIGAFYQMLDETFGKVDAGHLVYFMGQPTLDPGPWFYPYIIFFRLTPLTSIGALLSIGVLVWCWWKDKGTRGQGDKETRRQGDKERESNSHPPTRPAPLPTCPPAHLLWFFTVALLILGLLSPKKQDRYLLPLFPVLDILAVIGWYGLWQLTTHYIMPLWYASHIFGSKRVRDPRLGRAKSAGPVLSLPNGSRTRLELKKSTHHVSRFTPIFLALLVAVQILIALPWHPYYLAYFNPLMGGLPRAVETTLVGWGEGMEQVAAYLNQKPDAEKLYVASTPSQTLLPYFKGSGENFYTNDVALRSDYVVIYRAQQQRLAPSPEIVREYLNREPEHVVKIHGVPYAWIYPNQPLIFSDVPADYTLTNIGFGEVMRLAGYQLSADSDQQSVGSGPPSSFRLHPSSFTIIWHALPPIEQDRGPCYPEKVENVIATICPRIDYTVSVRVLAPDGSVVAQHDSSPANGLLPTSQWRVDDYVQDRHVLTLPPNAPSGEYWIEVVVYNAETGEALAGPVEAARFKF